jgi:hypothetical protein
MCMIQDVSVLCWKRCSMGIANRLPNGFMILTSFMRVVIVFRG